MKLIDKIRSKVVNWILKVVDYNGYATEDYVENTVRDEVNDASQYLVNQDWAYDLESEIEQNEMNIVDLFDKYESIENQSEQIESLCEDLDSFDTVLNKVDDDVDSLWITLQKLESFLKNRFQRSEEEIDEVFALLHKEEENS